jgi:hypothetical protein
VIEDAETACVHGHEVEPLPLGLLSRLLQLALVVGTTMILSVGLSMSVGFSFPGAVV